MAHILDSLDDKKLASLIDLLTTEPTLLDDYKRCFTYLIFNITTLIDTLLLFPKC